LERAWSGLLTARACGLRQISTRSGKNWLGCCYFCAPPPPRLSTWSTITWVHHVTHSGPPCATTPPIMLQKDGESEGGGGGGRRGRVRRRPTRRPGPPRCSHLHANCASWACRKSCTCLHRRLCSEKMTGHCLDSTENRQLAFSDVCGAVWESVGVSKPKSMCNQAMGIVDPTVHYPKTRKRDKAKEFDR